MDKMDIAPGEDGEGRLQDEAAPKQEEASNIGADGEGGHPEKAPLTNSIGEEVTLSSRNHAKKKKRKKKKSRSSTEGTAMLRDGDQTETVTKESKPDDDAETDEQSESLESPEKHERGEMGKKVVAVGTDTDKGEEMGSTEADTSGADGEGHFSQPVTGISHGKNKEPYTHYPTEIEPPEAWAQFPVDYVNVETADDVDYDVTQSDALSRFIAAGSYVQYPSPVLATTAVTEEPLAGTKKDSFVQHLAQHRRTQIVVGCIALVFFALAVVLGVTLSRNSSSSDDGLPGFFTEVGRIDGQTDQGQFGSSVSISGDGSRLAVGMPGVADSELSRCVVQVYELNEISQWVELGAPIEGSATDVIGYLSNASFWLRAPLSISLSHDGNAIAIGSSFHDNTRFQANMGLVEIYNLTSSGSWTLLGNALLGEGAEDLFGASVSLSKDGNIVAIGAPGDQEGTNSMGRVQVYELDAGNWIAQGTAIAGSVPGAMFGGSVSLSADGKMLAVGGSTVSFENTVSAIVRTFSFSDDWTEVGLGILPRDTVRNTAYLARLSSDGTILVISNYYLHLVGDESSNDDSNESLDVRAFKLDEDTWMPLGSPLHENVPGEKAGYVVSQSNDGLIIGLGDPGSEDSSGGADSGHAHIYQFDGKDWEQIGPDLFGKRAGDLSGFSVALSGDGHRFVTGAPLNRENGFEHGCIQIFEYEL